MCYLSLVHKHEFYGDLLGGVEQESIWQLRMIRGGRHGERNMDVKRTVSPKRRATGGSGRHGQKAISKGGERKGGGPAARKRVEGKNGSPAARR